MNTKNPEVYYRIALYIPFLDTLHIARLKNKFLEIESFLENFCVLFPNYNFDEEKTEVLFAFYGRVIECSKENSLIHVKMWKQ